MFDTPSNINPVVSILIPTYNRSGYLREAIDSVLKQTFTDFEIVVVDNCSTDDTPGVVASFTDSRINYIRNESNIGAVGNYNRALRAARGEFIHLFSDDDVMADSQNLELKVAVLNEYKNVGVVHSDVIIINAEGAVVSKNWAYGHTNWQAITAKKTILGAELFKLLYEGNNVINMPAVMLRRSILVEQKIEFNNQISYLVDWGLWLQLSLFCDFHYLNKPLIHYRVHSSNESSFLNNYLMFREMLIIKLGLFSLYEKNIFVSEYNLESIISSTKKQFYIQEETGSFVSYLIRFKKKIFNK